MNTMMKTTLALAAAGLSLAGAASAQTQTPAAGFNFDFSTIGTKLAKPQTGVGGTTLGLGFDPSNPKLNISSPTQATAQSIYETFTFDSSSAGAFQTIAAGQQAQFEFYGSNQNANKVGGVAAPFDVYATLYAYNPNAAAGTVPVSGPDLFGAPVKVTLGSTGGGYFSDPFAVAGSIVAGQSYVLGFTTLNSDTQDFATVSTSVNGLAGLSAADTTFDAQKFQTNVDDQGTPGAVTNKITSATFTSFALLNTTAAPEPSQFVTFGIAGVGMALVAIKRRRKA